ncbi:MAG: proton-conducting transporter membrane subunit, partial [Chloroflexota bacterium]
AMLSMGGYGLLRFVWQLMGRAIMLRLQVALLIAALVSEIYGALMCLAATDIKRIVAYSSVSQMGYFLFGLASLTPWGVSGAVLQIMTHGILKALLFMAVGIIIRASGQREIGRLGGLSARLPGAVTCVFLGAAGLAGVPPLVGFHSEWMILSGGLRSGYVLLGLLEFGIPVFTAAYGLWLALRLGLGTPRELPLAPVHPAMRWSSYAVALGALGLGVLPGPLYGLATEAAALLMRAGP